MAQEIMGPLTLEGRMERSTTTIHTPPFTTKGPIFTEGNAYFMGDLHYLSSSVFPSNVGGWVNGFVSYNHRVAANYTPDRLAWFQTIISDPQTSLVVALEPEVQALVEDYQGGLLEKAHMEIIVGTKNRDSSGAVKQFLKEKVPYLYRPHPLASNASSQSSAAEK